MFKYAKTHHEQKNWKISYGKVNDYPMLKKFTRFWPVFTFSQVASSLVFEWVLNTPPVLETTIATLSNTVKNENLTPQQADFNKSISIVRTSVEWVFGEILNYFLFLDYKKNLKIELSAVGKLLVLDLQHWSSISYGNILSDKFSS